MKDCVTVGNTQLSPKQYDILQKFKDIFCQHEDPVNTSDTYLLKWLKARDFKLDQAEKMLQDHLQWRKQYFNGKNIIQEKQPLVCLEYYTAGPIGFDKEGSPLALIRFGGMDVKGILQSVSLEEFRGYLVYIFNLLELQCESQTKKLGKLIENNTIIIDLGGFCFGDVASKAVLEFLCDVVKQFELNYPEALKYAIVVNAPWSFAFLWKIVKPLLNEKTFGKTYIFGNVEDYREFVASIIDDEALPAYLGGKLTDPDGNPLCITMVKLPQKVPESFKINKMKSLTSLQEIVLKGADFPFQSEFILPRNSFKSISIVNVQKEENCLLKWSFYTSGQDITFKIVKQDSNKEAGSAEHVLAEETWKKSSKLEPCKGEQNIETGFLYILRFDNTYSWFTSKTVHVSLELQESVNS